MALDPKTLQAALERRAPALRSFFAARIPPRLQRTLSADDLLNEFQWAAIRGRHTFHMDRPDALDRWLTSIAQNSLLNALKRERCKKRGGQQRFEWNRVVSRSYADLFARIVSPDRSPTQVIAVRQAAEAIQKALDGLPPSRRKVIELYFRDGKSQAQISRDIGRSVEAVRGLIYHGLRQLRRLLGPASQYLSDAPSDDGSC